MASKYYFWCIHLWIVCFLFVTAGAAEFLNVRVCEDESLKINCSEGIINIHSALYGRNNSEYCGGRTSQTSGQPCISEKSLTVMTQRCANKSYCSIIAKNDEFGDPCQGVRKYLEVDYTCDIHCACKMDNEVCEQTNTGVDCVCKPNFQRDAFNVCTEHHNTSTTALRKLSEVNEQKAALRVNITSENVVSVAAELEQESQQPQLLTVEDVEIILDVFSNIVDLHYPSPQVTSFLLSVTNYLMEVSTQVIDQIPVVGCISSILEYQMTSLLSKEDNYTEIMDNVGVAALHVSPSTFNSTSISFGSYSTETISDEIPEDLSSNNTKVYFNETRPQDVMSTITLPSALLDSIERANLSQNNTPLSFILFKDDTLFPREKENVSQSNVQTFISSQVISADVALNGIHIHDLRPEESVLIRFYSFPVTNGTDEKEERSCVFWKYNYTIGRGEWDTDGCNTMESEDRYVTCLCNHLTSFAVLVRVSTDPYIPNPILDHITDFGCICSIVGLSICVVITLVLRDTRRKQLTQIHINLSVALIALYATFLTGIDATSNYIRCNITSSLIHFFCLSSMAWMSVEAFNMFMFLFTMRRNNIKNLLLFGSLFSWGFPLAVSLAVYIYEAEESSNFKDKLDYCFLQPGFTLYFGFLLPMSIFFLFNSTVFVLITYRVSCRKILATNEEARRKAEKARIKGPFLFWILLGLSWAFGFLTIIVTPLTLVFEILFSLCLSLQGFFMFYMLTVNNPEIKVGMKRFKSSITGVFGKSVPSAIALRSSTTGQYSDRIQTAFTTDATGKI